MGVPRGQNGAIVAPLAPGFKLVPSANVVDKTATAAVTENVSFSRYTEEVWRISASGRVESR